MNAGTIILAVCIALTVCLLIKVMSLRNRPHDWQITGPTVRTCKVCKRKKSWLSRPYRRGQLPGAWETISPGNKGHRCSEKDAE